MFKTCLENRIIFRKSNYECILCKCKIPNKNMVSDHSLLNTHKERLQKINETIRNQESELLLAISENSRQKFVHNQISKCGGNLNSFRCHKCKLYISGSIMNVIEHIKGKTHSRKIKNLTQVQNIPQSREKLEDFIIADKNFFKCTICNCKIYGQVNVSHHIQGILHQSMLVSEKIKQSASINTLDDGDIATKSQSGFIEIRYCSICKVYLKNPLMLQCHVMLHLYTDYNIKSFMDIIEFDLVKSKMETQQNKKIIIKCLICNLFVSDEDLHKHLKTDVHSNRLLLFTSNKNDLQLNDLIAVQFGENAFIEKKFEVGSYLQKAFCCMLCGASVQKNYMNEHLVGRHKKRVSESLSKADIGSTINIDSKMSNINVYVCFLCDLSFLDMESLFEHYKTSEHQWNIQCLNMIYKCPCMDFLNFENKQVIHCSLCKVNIHNVFLVKDHLSDEKHNMLYTTKLSDTNLSSDKEQLKTQDVNINQQTSKNVNPKKENNCKVTIKKTRKRNKLQRNSKKLMKLGFTSQNIESLTVSELDSVDNVLNNLMKMDLNKYHQKKLLFSNSQRRSRKPNNEREKKSSFEKSVILHGENYIKLCIDPGKDNIYNIDEEKLKLIELGISLTIPWNSGRACLPCGENISDNYQVLFEHLQSKKHISCLREMELDHEDFENFPDQFSDLRLVKSYMKDKSEDIVQCFVCNIEITNEDSLIKSHIENANHIGKSKVWEESSNELISRHNNILKNIWYYAQVFVCDICKRKFDFEIDFVIHLKDINHIKRVFRRKKKESVLRFDGCPVCITYWFGESDSYNFHCESPFHKRFALHGDLRVPDMTIAALEFLNNAEEKVNRLVRESDKLIDEKQNEIDLLNAIKETVKSSYPNAETYIFGSRLSNLGFLDSDVDVFLDCENVYTKSTTQEQSKKYLSSVKKYFQNSSDIWIIEELLLTTRVPIIKLRHVPTGLKCDISFINGLSVEKSHLIGLYNDAYPICRQLILYLKKWLGLCQIFGSDCITAYAISWYVIFYLQINGILPTVHDLIKRSKETKFVDGWKCGFAQVMPSDSSDENFKEHLKGFFSYYTNFDYLKNVVCPYVGKIIEKRKFAAYMKLPVEMQLYKIRLMNNEKNVFRFDSPMCIQDPVDLSQNMTKAVKKQQLRCFKQYCKESLERL